MTSSEARRYPPTPRFVEPGLDVEPWSESFNDPDDVLLDQSEIGDAESVFRIAKRYLDGLVTLHLHLRVRSGGPDSDAHEFCGVVASDRGDVAHVKDLSYVFAPLREPRELAREAAFAADVEIHRERERLREGTANMDKPVLVHIVQPIEMDQVRLRRAFSVAVGLSSLDSCPIIRAYAAKSPASVPLIPLPAFVDGVLRAPSGATAPEVDELPDEIVKRGPQVVAELPDDEPDTGVGEFAPDAEDIFARIALEVSDDAAIYLVKPGEERGDFFVERAQVLVRSFKTPIDRF